MKPSEYRSLAGADRAELGRKQLGGHVLRRALQQAAFLVAGPPGKAEIAQLDAIRRGDEDIAGLDVAVDHAVGMEKMQAGQAIGQHQAKLIQVHRIAFGSRLETAPHQFQDNPTARADDVVDSDNVGMLQGGQQLGFLPVAGQLPLVGQVLGMDLLDGHLASQVAVAGTAHRGELAGGDRVENLVTQVRFHLALYSPNTVRINSSNSRSCCGCR